MSNKPLTLGGRVRRVAYRAAACVLFIGGIMYATSASAASVQVQVVSASQGQPLAGAAVCLGTPANPEQFGAHLSAADGTVLFVDVPRTSLLLTVSKPGHRGEGRRLDPTSSDRTIVVSLPLGGLGPECRVTTASAASSARQVRVSDFRINAGAASTRDRRVTLRFTAEGEPTHYRASETQDFAQAEWQDIGHAPSFELSGGSGRKTIYFQVRRYSALGDSSLEQISNVAADSITLIGQ